VVPEYPTEGEKIVRNAKMAATRLKQVVYFEIDPRAMLLPRDVMSEVTDVRKDCIYLIE
jgi:hypothetical protein